MSTESCCMTKSGTYIDGTCYRNKVSKDTKCSDGYAINVTGGVTRCYKIVDKDLKCNNGTLVNGKCVIEAN